MGEGASIDKFGSFFTLSDLIIESQIKMLSSWEKSLGKTITFRDLAMRGLQKNINMSINTRAIDFLANCQNLIRKEQAREVAIFDMDGTFYQLDGTDNGYSGSTLESKVLENATSFIVNREGCSVEKAEEIIQEGLKDPIGLSAFLSIKYQISREDYFNEVWNIDPINIITNFGITVKTIKELMLTDKKLILLTSAPKIWQQRVVKFLGFENAFEVVYTGGDYGQKEEIFKLLSQRYNPENITSIGDQENTDILPAEKFGIKGILIKNPNDLGNLFQT
jgi:FMN phosphatase YigB (HAD superfamily)